MPPMDNAAWREMWTALERLERRAYDLRRLSQYEPLKKPRPDYPHTGVVRSYDDEVQAVFADLTRAFAEVSQLLPATLPDGAAPPGAAPDDTPSVLAGRLSSLEKLTAALSREAFEPLPLLPPHAPPYLVTLPGHDVPSSKALILGNSILEIVGALRNALVGAANSSPGRDTAGRS